jgi:hypothetical protein
VRLNPGPGASIVAYPGANLIASSDAFLEAGGLRLANKPNFLIDAHPSGGKIPLGTFARTADPRGGLGRFGLTGDVAVDLIPGSAFKAAKGLFKPNVELPDWLKKFGRKVPWNVDVDVVDGSLVLNSMKVGPLDADLGVAAIKKFQLDYTGAREEWVGQGTLCILDNCRLEMARPFGGVVVRSGELAEAGAILNFKPEGITVFPGVTLDTIGFKVALDPTRVAGTAGITALKLIDIDGKAIVAFPSDAARFALDYPPGFPREFYGREFSRFTVGIAANAGLKLPNPIGRVPLSDGYFLYSYPGYVAFGGGVHKSLLGVIGFDSAFNGELNLNPGPAQGRYRLEGHQKACLIIIDDDLCVGIGGVISNRGFGACAGGTGGGYVYGEGVTVWLLFGCDWSEFDEKHVFAGRARAAQTGQIHVVHIHKGDPGRMIKLEGVGGAPRVRVTGPGGQTLDSTPGPGIAKSGALRIARTQRYGLTFIGLQDPKPGDYGVSLLPGSPKVRRISEAEDQPGAKVKADVTGHGLRRVLHYAVRRREAQRVTFLEETKEGVTRTIGVVTGGGRGKFSFSAPPGKGLRRIVASFELADMPAERLTVARYRPPSAKLGKPKRLRVRHRGTRLRLTWRGVPGAQRYEVLVTTSTGKIKAIRTRKRKLTVRRIAKSNNGVVSVRAVDKLRQGRAVSRRFRRTAKLKSRFKPLPRCKLKKKGLFCKTKR